MNSKELTKEQFEKIYRENSMKKCLDILGISHGTLYKYLDEYGIERKGQNKKLNIK